MTNLEYYKDEIEQIIKEYRITSIPKGIGIAFEIFSRKHLKKYPHCTDNFIDWLLEEHKEPIKLKQWEKDLLKSVDSLENKFFVFSTLDEMKRKGYFKGITDTSMTLKEILDNCEVVDD